MFLIWVIIYRLLLLSVVSRFILCHLTESIISRGAWKIVAHIENNGIWPNLTNFLDHSFDNHSSSVCTLFVMLGYGISIHIWQLMFSWYKYTSRGSSEGNAKCIMLSVPMICVWVWGQVMRTLDVYLVNIWCLCWVMHKMIAKPV